MLVLALQLLVASALAQEAPQPNPYTLALVVDGTPAAAKRAREFVAYLRATEPFSRMGAQLTYKLVELQPGVMICSNDSEDSKRIISCNTGVIAGAGAFVGANKTIAFTSQGSGGAGGSLPIASLDYPLTTMLHELMHSWNFGDEYAYLNATEADAFCPGTVNSRVNLAAFDPVKNPFDSDTEARDKHGPQIPWFGQVAATTLITTGNRMGTAPGIYPVGTPAVFEAGICARGTGTHNVATWKPYNQDTIMKSLNVNTIPPLYQASIVRAMGAERHAPIVLGAVADPNLSLATVEDLFLSKKTGPPAPSGASSGSGSDVRPVR